MRVWVERLTISNHPPLLRKHQHTRTRCEHVSACQPTSEIADRLRFTHRCERWDEADRPWGKDAWRGIVVVFECGTGLFGLLRF